MSESMERDWVVYSLAGPDGVVRYIGLTSNPRSRLRQHYYATSTPNTKMRAWLKSMRESGQVVTMRPVERVSDAHRIDASDVERKHILAFMNAGSPLFNAKPKLPPCHFVYAEKPERKKRSIATDLRYLKTGVRE